jgi:hypothetical protein
MGSRGLNALDRNQLKWDEEVGASYVGKYILVGLTFLDSSGKLKYRQQMHGMVESASFEKGIVIRLQGVYEGETWNMPPLLAAIRPAEPGRYVLEMSGETIDDPDLLATWTIEEPPTGRGAKGSPEDAQPDGANRGRLTGSNDDSSPQ